MKFFVYFLCNIGLINILKKNEDIRKKKQILKTKLNSLFLSAPKKQTLNNDNKKKNKTKSHMSFLPF